MTARAAATVPFATAAGLLAELAGAAPDGQAHRAVRRSRRRCRRRGDQRAGGRDQRPQARAPAAARASPGHALHRRRRDRRPGRGQGSRRPRGKAGDGKARTREVKLACLFTQTSPGDDGRPVRDPASTTYLATFEPAERFGVLLDAEARRRGCEHIRQITVLGDGAAWIWNLARQLFPAATEIVDLYHAREHLHDLANLAARLLAGHRDDWLAARLEELDAGNVGAILAAGRGLHFIGSLAGERDKALAYFEHNAHRMRYQHFRDLGMFTGSGVVETALANC